MWYSRVMKALEEMGRFKTVVIDPPWDIQWGGADSQEAIRKLNERAFVSGKAMRGSNRHGDGGYSTVPRYVKLNYETMSLGEIQDLPVSNVLEANSFLFLWATNAMLPHAIPMLNQWDCKYACTMVWHKSIGPKPTNRPYYNAEFIIVGHKGSPKYLDEKQFFIVSQWHHPRKQSQKPEGFYDLLRRVTPGPRLDVFGRRRIAGFTSWGNEAPEGEPLPDHYQQVLLEA